jgi:hypothetical protein
VKKMRIKVGYSMGYAGTDSEWEEDIPQDVVDTGKGAIEAYIEEIRQYIYEEACARIDVWVEIGITRG